jgi:hypothetical protein
VLLVPPLKINYRRADEHAHAGMTYMQFIGKLPPEKKQRARRARPGEKRNG